MLDLFKKPTPYASQKWSGLRIGLFGGSFNPPHAGHVHVSLSAMKMLKLDAVWWLVSPQNPIKSSAPAPLGQRMQQCRSLTNDPRIIISDIEKALGTNRTYDTVTQITKHFPTTDFVWICGMDNAHIFHQWYRWKELAQKTCLAFITRPPATELVKHSKLHQQNALHHHFIKNSAAYPLDKGSVYWALQNKMINLSSTEIRRKTSKNS